VKRVLRVLFIAVVAGLAGYVTWDRAEAYRLSKDIDAIVARGEPTDLSSLDSAPQTSEQQEAAQLYAEAATRARAIAQQDFRVSRIDVDAVVGRVDVPDLEGTFRSDTPALQLLDRATPLPFAGFGDLDDGFETTSGLQSLSALSALRADLLAYRGDGDAAVASLVAAIRVQRTLPDLFNRYAVSLRQFGSLRILLRHAVPATASLEALQRAFAELPDEDGLDRDLIRRRAWLIEQREEAMAPGGISRTVGFLLHPFLVRAVRVQVEGFPEVIAAAREPWPAKFETLSALGAANAPRATRSPRQQLIGPPVNLAALAASPAAAGVNVAVRRLAIATLAIERYRRVHGAVPSDLSGLVPAFLPAVPIDPFTGQPFVYRAGSDAYLLYSVDVNRRDDGGQLYGIGSLNPMPLPRDRDFGIKVPLIARSVAR
jgi:hypothetical protein